MKKVELPIWNIPLACNEKTGDFLSENFSISTLANNGSDLILDYPIIVESIVFGICIAGKGEVEFNLRNYTIEKNSVFVLYPQTICQYDTTHISDDFELKYISFSFEFIGNVDSSYLYSAITDDPCIRVRDDESKLLLNLYASLEEKFNLIDNPYKTEIIQHTLLAAIYEFCTIYEKRRSIVPQIPTQKDNLLKDFYALIFKYHKRERRINFYADQLCLSPKYLSAVVKMWTNKTVLEWINEYTILSAKALLKSSDIAIQELAFHFNFPDATSFSKFFKKQTGKTPKEYRKGE